MTDERREGFRVLVCGGRDYRDGLRVRSALSSLPARPTVLIAGGAPGADYQAALWAECNKVKREIYQADWGMHGRAAGPIRNQRMIDEGKPDYVVAFPGGRGTADMVRRAKAAGIPVREVHPEPPVEA